MLLWNYSVIHKSPWKFLWWVGAICDNNWGKNGQRMAIYTEASIPDQWGLPVWYSSGWMLPRKSGFVVWFSEMSLSQSGTAVMWVNGDGNVAINLNATADLSLVVSATGICDILLTLTGDAVGALYANWTSNIDLTATGTLGAVAFSTGESSITLSASADISALGYMTGEMTPFTELSPEWLASAVWNSLATEYNTTGTMGAKLNLASSGWVDMNALAQVVWEYGVRSLTESAGLSTEEHDKLMSLSSGWWWASINYSAINSHTTSKVNELKEEIAKIPKTDLSGIENTLNEISSQNDIAKEDIIDTIKEIENEICSDIIRKSKDIETSNVKTRQLIRQKAEKIDKNISKLSDRQDLTDKMIEDEADELEDQIEALYEKEADDLEKEIDDKLNEEFDQIESETNQLTNGNN